MSESGERNVGGMSITPANLFASLTIKLWILIFAIAFVAIFLGALVAHFFGVEVPLLNDFLNLLAIGGGGATARNVITDGIAPRIVQAVAVNKEGSAALLPPDSGPPSTPPPTATFDYPPKLAVGG